MREIIVVLHNIRSSHNVGSILRTSDGFGVKTVYLTGYTPYPRQANDQRLPYISQRVEKEIHKTALGAEDMVDWRFVADIKAVVSKLRDHEYQIIAIEQSALSQDIFQFKPRAKVALIFGSETAGLADDVINISDMVVEIPMIGKKESFNVGNAAAIAIYHCRLAK